MKLLSSLIKNSKDFYLLMNKNKILTVKKWLKISILSEVVFSPTLTLLA